MVTTSYLITFKENEKRYTSKVGSLVGCAFRSNVQLDVVWFFTWATATCWVSWVALVVKNLPANEGDVREVGSIPGLGRSPGKGYRNPLPYSCLENPMDREAWWATVHGVAKSWTWLKWLSTHTHSHLLAVWKPLGTENPATGHW